jgi:sugar phosphate isomerase/epimerase
VPDPLVPAAHAWRLGYNTLTWNETRDPDGSRVFATIAEAGWEGIELLDPDLNWWGSPARIRRMAEAAGIPVVAVLGVAQPEDARRRRQTELQKRQIDLCAELGAGQYVFIGGDRVYRRLPTDDDLGRLADVASELAAYAAPLGVTVSHHSHPRCTIERESEQDRFLELTDPRVQVCIDVGISAFMDEDWLGQIAKYAGRTAYVHLKDWALGKYCVLGDGTKGIDWRAVLEAFTGTGFDGWITTELSWYGDSDADEACVRNRAYLRSLGY